MLKKQATHEIDLVVERYPCLSSMREQMLQAVMAMKSTYLRGGTILTCGNGGSAADSLHIVGELMKSFVAKRSIPAEVAKELAERFPEDAEFYLRNLQGAVPAISLVNEVSLMTAFGNDKSSELVFAQQVLGYGKPGDVLIAISTSGNSANVLHAAKVARCMGIHVISLTGEGGGKLKDLSDILLAAPSQVTYQIQELHLPVYHALCLSLESELFSLEECDHEP